MDEVELPTSEIVGPILEDLLESAYQMWEKKRKLSQLDGRGDDQADTANEIASLKRCKEEKVENERNDDLIQSKNLSIRDFPTKEFFFESGLRFHEEPLGYKILYQETDLEEPSLPCIGPSESYVKDDDDQFPLVRRSKKFVWLPDIKETVINVVEPDDDDPFLMAKNMEFLEEPSLEEEDTRRRVYWSGPGLLQERHVKSIFLEPEIPEGMRPTLAYVSSEEMVKREHVSTHSVVLGPDKNASQINTVRREHDETKKSKKPFAKRVLSSLKKAVGFKS